MEKSNTQQDNQPKAEKLPEEKMSPEKLIGVIARLQQLLTSHADDNSNAT
jgi:hypothetical protein